MEEKRISTNKLSELLNKKMKGHRLYQESMGARIVEGANFEAFGSDFETEFMAKCIASWAIKEIKKDY